MKFAPLIALPAANAIVRIMTGGNSLQDDKILYWRKGDAVQNFGDFLSEIFIRDLFKGPKVKADRYRLIGSVIAEGTIFSDVQEIRAAGGSSNPREFETSPTEIIAYWGCGAREDRTISEELLSHCAFYGVRGPLTRELLGLSPDTVLGDPAFVLPLIYRKKIHRQRGPAICIPHFHEKMSDQDLLTMTGADEIVTIKIANDPDKLFEVIDRITGASFVLTGSLHAAIIACAYDIPFAYLDTGFVDCPFKWDDFSRSVSIPTVFVKNMTEAKVAYQKICKGITKPSLFPILNSCPYKIRFLFLLRALTLDLMSGAYKKVWTFMHNFS